MYLTRRSLRKWTVLTLVCGAQSLFWGSMVTHGAFTAMVLGMTTLVLMFACIESHPHYQAARAGSAHLARALDLGIKIRWIYGLIYPIGLLINTELLQHARIFSAVLLFSSADVWIGMAAMWITDGLTTLWWGKTFIEDATQGGRYPINFEYASTASEQFLALLPHHLAVYFTTVLTGLMHTLILALLCAIIYAILRLRGRYAPTITA